VILGVLLGNLMEANLRRALTISNGDWTALFASPLALILWAIAIAGFVLPIVIGRTLKGRIAAAKAKTDELVD
jgi:putative tricarboxylic transport membrane protein